MKRLLIGSIVLATAACASQVPGGSSAGEVAVVIPPPAADLNAAYEFRTWTVDRRIATLQSYVDWVESRLPGVVTTGNSLRQTSVSLSPRAFSDVTDERWQRLDAFYDGTELKRLRLIPPAGGDQRTEEFYFSDGKLLYVFFEDDGAKKRDPHDEARGDSFYFGREGLIAWIRPNGSRPDPSSAEFKAKSKLLLLEADRFPRDAKMP